MLFISPQKHFLFLMRWNFCPDDFGNTGKQLDEKQSLISKFIMSFTGKQVVTTHMPPNISRSDDNKTIMQFGQLIEYNMRKIFLQKPCRK